MGGQQEQRGIIEAIEIALLVNGANIVTLGTEGLPDPTPREVRVKKETDQTLPLPE